MMIGQALTENDACLTELTNVQSTGLAFIVICSLFSFLAISIVLGFHLLRVMTASHASEGPWIFLKTDIDAYFLSLLFSDMLVAVSGILNLKWLAEGSTSCGSFCSTQGGLEHIGMPAVALSTLAITMHTFFLIFFGWQAPRSRVIGLSVLIGIWAFLIILVVIPALMLSSDTTRPPFYTPSPAWCYIDVAHIGWAAGSSYVLAWLAALSSVVVYVLLFLRLRGVLVGRWWSIGRVRRHTLSCSRSPERSNDMNSQRGFNLSGREVDGDSSDPRSTAEREASKMLWYPLCYLVIILPISVVRWTSFEAHGSRPPKGNGVSFALMAAAASLFKLGGLADVLLFTFTRPNVLSLDIPRGEHSIYRSAKRWVWERWKTVRCRFGGNDNDGTMSRSVNGEGDEFLELDELRDATLTTRIAKRPGENGSQVSLLESPRSSALAPSAPQQDRPRLNRLEIDLAEELPYYGNPVSPSLSILGSSSSTVGTTHDRGRHQTGLSLFTPLTLELPDPRISGMNFFMDSGSSRWTPLEREERLAFTGASSSAPSSREKSIQMRNTTKEHAGTSTGQVVTGLGLCTSINEPFSGGFSFPQRVHHEPLSPRGEKDSDNLDALPKAHSVSSKREKVALGPHRTDIWKRDDPIGGHSPSLAYISRERRLHGPRPVPGRRSSSAIKRPRPSRPTINIPPSGSSTSFPSPRSSERSPRMRYPRSALASIPEHHSLDQFPQRFSPILPATTPLSLRARSALTRTRSLSDGAQHEQRGLRRNLP